MSLVAVEMHEKSVALVRLGRPEALCVLDARHITDLLAAVERVGRDPDVRAVVVTGQGRAFCAGGDLRWMAGFGGPDSGEPMRQLTKPFHAAMVELRRMPKPVVAAVNGVAAGGGLSLALGADLRVAARRAFFRVAYLTAGLTPDGGLTWLLPRVVGHQQAVRMILRNDDVSAVDALACGLVDELADDDRVVETALALATRLADWPGDVAAASRRLLDLSGTSTFETQLEEERAAITAMGRTAAHREALSRFLRRS
ncbi:MAG: enoyl-CoA hydratase/isomerase family protein [Acidimicrobiia bacterium]